MSTINDVVVVGSGPNGLMAAILLAKQGLKVTILEKNSTPGGGMRSKELTEPGFIHDVCSAVHPLASSAKAFRSLNLEKYGLEWVYPEINCAQPYNKQEAVCLYSSLEQTLDQFSKAGQTWYKRLLNPLLDAGPEIFNDLLAPITQNIPSKPLNMASFGIRSLWPADYLPKVIKDDKVTTLLSGMTAHSILPFDSLMTTAFSIIFSYSGHCFGWPFAKGGSQKISDAMISCLLESGGNIIYNHPVTDKKHLPEAKCYIMATSPLDAIHIFKDEVKPSFRKSVENYKYGAGLFKIDWALKEPVPFANSECRKSGTLHIGGSFEEISRAEKLVSEGKNPDKPFVLFSQPTLWDSTRAPKGKHVGWAYCHVPNGSTEDRTEAIENRIEEFAPGFKDIIISKHTINASELETYNPNYIGGDVGGGMQTLMQQVFRPVVTLDPYKLPIKNAYLASAATPPGGGVHGMCGYYAAKSALKNTFSKKLKSFQ